MAERIVLARVRGGAAIAASSAGTRAVVGHGVGTESAVTLRELGADPGDHHGRRLLDQHIRAADLILTAETRHREQILRDSPAAMRRTFTLLEFVRLSGAVAPIAQVGRRGRLPDRTELREQVALVAAQRGLVTPARSVEDIADPVGASLEQTRECAILIADCVDALLTCLGLAQPS